MSNKNECKTSLKEVIWQAIRCADSAQTALQVLPDPESGMGGEKITYGELAGEVARRTEEFHSKGLTGKRIGILMERRTSVIMAFLACLVSECSAVLLDPEEDRGKILQKLERTECALLLGKRGTESFREVKEADPDEAYLLFTSGTTGEEKCVVRTRENVRTSVEFSAAALHHGVSQLLNLPLHHQAAWDRLLLPALMKGCTITVSRGAGRWLEEINTCRPEELFVVPAQAALFLKLTENEKEGMFPFLHAIISTGAALPTALTERFAARKIECPDVYGSSEAGCITNPVYKDGTYNIRPGSVGKLQPELTYRIDNPDPDGYGELLIKGTSVFPGYLDNSAETKAVLQNGWFHTGDLAKTDDDGFLYLNGRIKNLIILSSGENVSPEKLEERIVASEGIRECLCFEYKSAIAVEIVPDKDWFDSHPYVDQETWIREKTEEINAALPAYERISHWYLRKKPIERTAAGKPKRAGLTPPEEDVCLLLKTIVNRQGKGSALTPGDVVIPAFEQAFPGRKIGAEDDFFALGGDSLTAMQITAAISEEGFPVSVRELFYHPRIRDLTLFLQKNDTDFALPVQNGIIAAPEITEEEAKEIRAAFPDMTIEAVFPIHGFLPNNDPISDKMVRHGRGMYFLDHMLIPKVPFGEEAFFERVRKITARHPLLRAKYIQTSGGWRQVIIKEQTVPAFYMDWSSEKKDAAEKLKRAVEEYRARYEERKNEELPDPFRLYCCRLSEDQCVIFMELTHLGTDWTSEQLLIQEILNGPKKESEDHYFECRIRYDCIDDQSSEQAVRYLEQFDKIVAEENIRSISWEGWEVFPPKEHMVSVEEEETALIRKYGSKNGATLTETAAFILLHAIMESFGMDSILFMERFDGRKNMPFDASDTVGAFFYLGRCFLRKTDTLTDYHRRLARVAVYSKKKGTFLRRKKRNMPLLINKLVAESILPDNCAGVAPLKNNDEFLLLGAGIRGCKIEARGKDFAIRFSYTGGDAVRKRVEQISDRVRRMLGEICEKMREEEEKKLLLFKNSQESESRQEILCPDLHVP